MHEQTTRARESKEQRRDWINCSWHWPKKESVRGNGSSARIPMAAELRKRRTAAEAGLAETVEPPSIDSGARTLLEDDKVGAGSDRAE